jgi:hypothetical protein
MATNYIDETADIKQLQNIMLGDDVALKSAVTKLDTQLKTVADSVTTATNASKVTITDTTTTEGYLKTYTFTQGETEIGKIDIPKDFLVKSGSLVKNPAGQDEGTYIALVLNTKSGDEADSTIYIKVTDLIDVYEGFVGDEVTVKVEDYTISAEITKVAATKVKITKSDSTETDAQAAYTDHESRIAAAKASIDTLTGTEDTAGSVAKALKDAKAYADEVAGALDDELAAVAKSGAAADVTITKPESLTSTNVDTAITEIAGKVDALEKGTYDDTEVRRLIGENKARLDAINDAITTIDDLGEMKACTVGKLFTVLGQVRTILTDVGTAADAPAQA